MIQPPAGRAHTAARRTAGGRDKVRKGVCQSHSLVKLIQEERAHFRVEALYTAEKAGPLFVFLN